MNGILCDDMFKRNSQSTKKVFLLCLYYFGSGNRRSDINILVFCLSKLVASIYMNDGYCYRIELFYSLLAS